MDALTILVLVPPALVVVMVVLFGIWLARGWYDSAIENRRDAKHAEKEKL